MQSRRECANSTLSVPMAWIRARTEHTRIIEGLGQTTLTSLRNSSY